MKVEQFLEHHGIAENPFSQEDAQNDHVFREHCLEGTRHPAWDKIYSNPLHPSTAVIFGEKGSGKTALRLQIADQLRQFSRENTEQRAFIIDYEDFNPFLDSFRERLHGRKKRGEKALGNWRLWDHMDAILSLGVTKLCDDVLENNQSDDKADSVDAERLALLSRIQQRDLLLLAAFYDHSLGLPRRQRWRQLARKLKFRTWKSEWDRVLGVVGTLLLGLLTYESPWFRETFGWWIALSFLIPWLPWLWRQSKLLLTSWRVSRQIRVLEHLPNTLRRILAKFLGQDISGQPVPYRNRSDDRYELLAKFQSILKTLGFESIVVLVDRVDEPHLIDGSAERMRDFLWPMFDNKFLKHPGMAFKLLLPADVVPYLNREEKQFYERSRLDKQNLISSLSWTGESLYDIASDRIRACAKQGDQPQLRSLFDDSISEEELIATFARFRVPRHLFKFLYRLMVDHCGKFTQEKPSWAVSRETMQATLALYMRDMETLDRGAGTG